MLKTFTQTIILFAAVTSSMPLAWAEADGERAAPILAATGAVAYAGLGTNSAMSGLGATDAFKVEEKLRNKAENYRWDAEFQHIRLNSRNMAPNWIVMFRQKEIAQNSLKRADRVHGIATARLRKSIFSGLGSAAGFITMIGALADSGQGNSHSAVSENQIKKLAEHDAATPQASTGLESGSQGAALR